MDLIRTKTAFIKNIFSCLNCLLVVGRSLVKLICSVGNKDFGFISNILKGISRVPQRIRPGRHLPRQSRKPINKWKTVIELRSIMLNRMPLG